MHLKCIITYINNLIPAYIHLHITASPEPAAIRVLRRTGAFKTLEWQTRMTPEGKTQRGWADGRSTDTHRPENNSRLKRGLRLERQRGESSQAEVDKINAGWNH